MQTSINLDSLSQSFVACAASMDIPVAVRYRKLPLLRLRNLSLGILAVLYPARVLVHPYARLCSKRILLLAPWDNG
jgi:hypothetical protein